MAYVKIETPPNAGKDVDSLNHSHIGDGNVKSYSHSWKQLVSLKKNKQATTIWPTIVLLDIYRGIMIYIHMKTCTEIFIAALCIGTPKLESKTDVLPWWMVKQHSPSVQFTTAQWSKGMDMQQFGWISMELHLVKYANLKRLHMVWFYIYIIFF